MQVAVGQLTQRPSCDIQAVQNTSGPSPPGLPVTVSPVAIQTMFLTTPVRRLSMDNLYDQNYLPGAMSSTAVAEAKAACSSVAAAELRISAALLSYHC
jgi:hypothetical protein